MKPKTVKQMAFADIAKYNKENSISNMKGDDSWDVTITYLDTKEQRELNRVLGLQHINKGK